MTARRKEEEKKNKAGEGGGKEPGKSKDAGEGGKWLDRTSRVKSSAEIVTHSTDNRLNLAKMTEKIFLEKQMGSTSKGDSLSGWMEWAVWFSEPPEEEAESFETGREDFLCDDEWRYEDDDYYFIAKSDMQCNQIELKWPSF